MPEIEEYVEEIKDLWDSHWLTNMGAKHKEFQKQLEDLLGVEHVALYCNGHLALENILEAMQMKKGGETRRQKEFISSWSNHAWSVMALS